MIITVPKIVIEFDGEQVVNPDTAAKSWRNVPELETETTMTIEILEA